MGLDTGGRLGRAARGAPAAERGATVEPAGASRRRVGLAALVVLLAAACGVLASPSLVHYVAPEAYHRSYFRRHRAEYQRAAIAAVDKVEAHSGATLETRIDLPSDTRQLADGGAVWVDSKPGRGYWVTFFRSRGILGDAWVLLYTTNAWTSDEIRQFYDDVERLGDGWFLVYEA